MFRTLLSLCKIASICTIATSLAIASSCLQASPAQPGRKFKCELVGGFPTTVVKTVRGNIPMIHWVKSFTGRYNNINRRCQEVSARLDRFNQDGELKFIRTGNVNTYPVLCVDPGVNGNTCPKTRVLVTLPKGSDSSQILQQMLDLRARASGKIIQLSGEQLVRYHQGNAYVNIDRLLLQ
jgi:Circadian oscillating protein COP23